MHIARVTVAIGVLALRGWAQPATAVAGPVTGFVFDAQSRAVRPMLGIPGAAYLGKVMATDLDTASISPDGSTLLAVQRTGKLVVYSGLRNETPVLAPINGAIAGADHFAWSANSQSAAVYSSGDGKAQILAGLAASPATGAPIDLSGLPGKVTALAFDGQQMFVGVTASGTGGIYAAGASGSRLIAASADPSAMALAGSSLYFADSQAQQIFQIENYAGTPSVSVFSSEGIDSPAGLQISADGQRIYSANEGDRTLTVYDTGSHSLVQTIGLQFTPTRLDLFGDSSVFLLNDGGSGPLYVVRDAAAGKAMVYFVPVSRKPRLLREPVGRS